MLTNIQILVFYCIIPNNNYTFYAHYCSTNFDLWNFQTADGKTIEKGIAYLHPFVADKTKWSLPRDVMYWNNWPVAQPFLVFGSVHFENKNWFNTWQQLDHAPKVEEVIRNLPVRNPVIWID